MEKFPSIHSPYFIPFCQSPTGSVYPGITSSRPPVIPKEAMQDESFLLVERRQGLLPGML